MARVKYCSAPSMRCAESSSEVRSTAISRNSSGPISFCPPSPRLFCTSIDAQAHAVSEIREERVGLVVGVGRRLQECAGDAELAQRQTERDVAAAGRSRREGHAVLRMDRKISGSHRQKREAYHGRTQQKREPRSKNLRKETGITITAPPA